MPRAGKLWQLSQNETLGRTGRQVFKKKFVARPAP